MRTKTRREIIIARLRDLGLEQQKLLQELAAMESKGKGYSRKCPEYKPYQRRRPDNDQ